MSKLKKTCIFVASVAIALGLAPVTQSASEEVPPFNVSDLTCGAASHILIEPVTLEPIIERENSFEIVEIKASRKPEEKPVLPQSDISLLAQLVMAEAEGEPEEGKRLVVDTVLNRVDCREFPNSIRGVIFQKGQFSCINDGRFDRCYATDELIQIVEEELSNRSNYDVTYFRTVKYSSYGVPLFQVGHHYFSACKSNCVG